MTDSEWDLASEATKTTIEQAKSRRERRTGGEGANLLPRRVDWLGDITIMVGMRLVQGVEMKKALPGRNPCETWELAMRSRRA